MNIVIIQARMNSSRFPGKVLKKIKGKAVLEWVIDRVSLAEKIDLIILATGEYKINKKINKLCNKLSVICINGENDNVLKRYIDIIEYFKFHDEDNIIRITADCPLIDGRIIDDMLRDKFDLYIGNQNNMIDGTDIEIIKVKLLKEMCSKFKFDEHVTLEWKNTKPDMNYYHYDNKDRSNIHLSLDTKKDFKVIKNIIKDMDEYFNYEELINYLGVK